MLLHGFGEGAENDSGLAQFRLECGRHGDAVEDGIHSNSRQQLLFFQRNPQLLIGPQNLRIERLQALQGRFLLGRGVVHDILIIDRAIFDVGPLGLSLRLFQRGPVPVSLESPLKHELGLVFFCRNQANDVFVQTLRHILRFTSETKPHLYSRSASSRIVSTFELIPFSITARRKYAPGGSTGRFGVHLASHPSSHTFAIDVYTVLDA